MVVCAKVPLICFEIMEWHVVDRVIGQFEMRQNISDDLPNIDELHDIDMRGRIIFFVALPSLSLD